MQPRLRDGRAGDSRAVRLARTIRNYYYYYYYHGNRSCTTIMVIDDVAIAVFCIGGHLNISRSTRGLRQIQDS